MYHYQYILQSTTPVAAVTFILLLIVTCFIAWKNPSKLYAIGTIALVWGILLFVLYGTHTFDNIQKWADETTWRTVIPTLRKAFSSLLWACIIYLISRILYIIRTPRI